MDLKLMMAGDDKKLDLMMEAIPVARAGSGKQAAKALKRIDAAATFCANVILQEETITDNFVQKYPHAMLGALKFHVEQNSQLAPFNLAAWRKWFGTAYGDHFPAQLDREGLIALARCYSEVCEQGRIVYGGSFQSDLDRVFAARREADGRGPSDDTEENEARAENLSELVAGTREKLELLIRISERRERGAEDEIREVLAALDSGA